MRLGAALLPVRSVACLAAAAVVALGCASFEPSRAPLGWGPAVPNTAAPGSEERRVTARRPSRPSRHGAVIASTSSPTEEDGDEGDEREDEPPKNVPVVASSEPSRKESELRSVPSKEWAGDYRGADVAVYRLKGLPDRTERDPNARTTVKAPAEDSVSFVLVDSSNGNEICTLESTLKGPRATIREGQHCFDQNGGGASLTTSVTSGFATLDEKTLHLEVKLDVEMKLEGLEAGGTLDYRFDGPRK